MPTTKNPPFASLLCLAAALSLGCTKSNDSGAVTSTPTTSSGAGDEVQTEALSLDAIVASADRSPENRARDAYRHPVETLTFFGVEPGMRILEVRPGSGWYTEILALFVQNDGQLIVGVPSADGRRAKYRNRFLELKAARPAVLGEVDVVTFDPPTPIDLGPDGSVDMVVTFRNTHNWISDGGEEEAYAAFFDVLRPGGILGVVQHRADDDADPQESAKNGYVPEPYVIAVAERAGFESVGSSDINRNEQDSHDHPAGVWTLPPVLRLGDADRATYEAIGESDRMTLKFRKPTR